MDRRRFNGRPPLPLRDRFWARVDVKTPQECWNWLGSKVPQGYGMISAGGANSKNKRAHRVSYELTHGSIPDNLFVLHRCDNPSCVNPNHLYLGTNQDNMDDMKLRGRQKTPVMLGEDCSSAKLTENQVREIRDTYQKGGVSQAKLAKQYGVDQSTVCDIVNYKIWKHVNRRTRRTKRGEKRD